MRCVLVTSAFYASSLRDGVRGPIKRSPRAGGVPHPELEGHSYAMILRAGPMYSLIDWVRGISCGNLNRNTQITLIPSKPGPKPGKAPAYGFPGLLAWLEVCQSQSPPKPGQSRGFGAKPGRANHYMHAQPRPSLSSQRVFSWLDYCYHHAPLPTHDSCFI